MTYDRGLAPDFRWGAATAAYQIEGAVAEDGRSPSIWDTFCRVPGAIDNGDTGDVACDHYHRWPEDIGLMRRLGLDSYRFSIAWPRVLPGRHRRGQRRRPRLLRPAGRQSARRGRDAVLRRSTTGISPRCCRTAAAGRRARRRTRSPSSPSVVGERLGDRVTDWFTVNEPLCSAWIGHLEGTMAPGIKDLSLAVPASHHLLLGHGLATAALRAAAPGAGAHRRGPESQPVRAGERHRRRRRGRAAGRRPHQPLVARPALRARLSGRHDRGVRHRATGPRRRPRSDRGTDGPLRTELLLPAGRHRRPDRRPAVRAHGVACRTGRSPRWAGRCYADGLEQLLVRLSDEYGVRRIYVTENGSAWPDEIEPDGNVEDKDRIAYLEQHLEACLRAARHGAPVAGYFAWSLLDNFEWAYGYAKRFGLVHVDYDTQRRTIKASGYRYADIIRTHRERHQRRRRPAVAHVERPPAAGPPYRVATR